MAKRGTSFRLSEEGIEAINDMSEMLGISQADVVEMSVRISARAIERGIRGELDEDLPSELSDDSEVQTVPQDWGGVRNEGFSPYSAPPGLRGENRR